MNQNDITHELVALQNQLYDITARNPFVNVKVDKLWFHNSEQDQLTKADKIYRKQNFYLKEYGLETTLQIALFVKWKLPSNDRFYLSPILYKPARLKKIQRIDLRYEVVLDESESWLINPVISHLFKLHFNYHFDQEYLTVEGLVEALKVNFNSEQGTFKEIYSFNDVEEWQIIQREAIGTFNYQKSTLANDFTSIIQSPSKLIKQIFGYVNLKPNSYSENELDWYPLDSSQKQVVAFATNNNMVIQGPPGTGKSHTIVALLQHYIQQGKKVLFVSEKKSALDIVYKRLGVLRPLAAYFDAEKRTKLSYYSALKKAYEKIQNRQEIKAIEYDSGLLAKSLIYPRDVKATKEGDIAISKLQEKLILNSSPEVEPHVQSVVPSFNDWNNVLPSLKKIEKLAKNQWKVEVLGKSNFLNINKAVFKEENPIPKIDKKLDQLIHQLNHVKHIQKDYGINANWNDYRKLCLSASVLNMVNRAQMDLLFNTTKSYKSFNVWAKKYQLIKNQLDSIRFKNSSWKKRPTIDLIEKHLQLLKSKSILKSFKIKNSHKSIFQYYHSSVAVSDGEEILLRLMEEWELETKLNEVAIKLKHNLNVIHPDTEIDFILNIRQKTESIGHNYYQTILEHEEHEELISLLADQHQVINNINRIQLYLFTGDIPSKIENLLTYLLAVKNELLFLNQSKDEVLYLLNLPPNLLNFVKLNLCSIEQLTKIVVKNELSNQLKYQQYLADLTGKRLEADIKKFNHTKRKVFKQIQDLTYFHQVKKWQKIEELCSTPNSKLDDLEKSQKKKYKVAKRIAIHEMNKTRQLMPIKDLFQHAQDVIMTLQPVWIMNPLAISERLPLEKEIFDVVIFDESSQIPIEDAIPAIYRAQQIVIVGDGKQMPPNQFFTGNKNVTTLLTQGEKFLPSKSLLWHYRSEHPQLISFSNEHFYDNELKLFPEIQTEKPIDFHYIANGAFIDSVNQFEAQAIAHRLKEILAINEKEIAIIALSKEQEKCIRAQIAKAGIEVPESVMIRNLESVQGVEKNVVLISIGYAVNAEGKLSLNFGPINQSQGANRLNVLFSRAVKKMEIFSSIKSADIGLSENRGLSILSQFLQFASGISFKNYKEPKSILEIKIAEFLKLSNIKYRYHSADDRTIVGAFSDTTQQKLLLVNPGVESTDDINLSAVLEVLNQRFKAVKIILNADWIASPTQVKNELLEFFT